MPLIPDLLPRRHAKPYQPCLQQQLQQEHLGEDFALTHLLRPVKGPEGPLKFRSQPCPYPSRTEAGGDSFTALRAGTAAEQGKPDPPGLAARARCRGRERGSHSTARSCPLFLISSLPHIRQQQTTRLQDHPSQPRFSPIMTQYFV